MNEKELVWVFLGEKAIHSAGVFSDKSKAESWIMRHKLTGILTGYPIDIPIYDWAINEGYFKITKDHQSQAEFIQRFSSASLPHEHYEDGECSSR